VIALGGNALLPRGAEPEASLQLEAAKVAARQIAGVLGSHRVVVTHGNGPQVGLLALMGEAYGQIEPYPLDVLDAESEGQLGYVIEMEIDNAAEGRQTVAVVTRVEVDPDDPAFTRPTKFIGPTYDEQTARELASARGWDVALDGDSWRRVVASPEPRRIVQLPAIRELVESGFIVVCAGGGGIPVVDRGGIHLGVEAVIDKDLSSARLAADLGADVFVMATDVDAVYDDFGSDGARAISRTDPEGLRRRDFPAGSMGPKAEAACRMVEETGGRAAIGALTDLAGLLEGSAGTQVSASNTGQG
jgi:carbamate kinase